MKKFYTLLAAAAVAISAVAADPAKELYIIGSEVVVPGHGWDPANGIACQTTSEEGVFTYELSLPTAEYFGFIPKLGTWDEVNPVRYVPAAGSVLNAGLNPMKVGGDASFNLPAGDYKLTINTVNLTINVEGNVVVEMGDLYLRGDMNDWLNAGMEDAYKFSTTDENVYTLTLAKLEAGVNFKIANKDWLFSFVAAERVTPLEGEEEIEPNIHLAADTPYYYTTTAGEGFNNCMENDVENVTIILNIEEETILFSTKSGIAGVEVEDAAEAVYYNLQGVRVANPENGLFIEVKGGKAAKVIR